MGVQEIKISKYLLKHNQGLLVHGMLMVWDFMLMGGNSIQINLLEIYNKLF